MSPYAQHIKITLAAASAILAAASVAPAAAQEHPAPANTAHHDPHNQHQHHGDHRDHDGRHHQPDHNGHHHFQGRIIAHGGLNVRKQPTTHSHIIGLNPEGSLVTIRCKVNGEWINGNPRWYMLADKTHGWSAARYIRNVGPAPDWCLDRNDRRNQPNHNQHHYFQGRIIAHGGLNVRKQPTTHSHIIGLNPEGSLVTIRCKVNGEWINGNPRWYKLADKTHGWSAARYIRNVGRAPDWCLDHNEHGQGNHEHGGHGNGEHGHHGHS
ncbi:SH3 domain-containing protein [Streptantibioticus ferralitis]|uniref:SH3 domain-containing protein n=1 Tax=Streptantibioticus ferralitis TaxID=236510 RepID=A0ABT5YWW5_9ACTN|nr:SH3 domain-containing protein [Streptantibioticus ferralitis]MDF2255939.1 SH3 domain-containing protein [Streptantibioticus ferralitis]